MKNHNDMFEKQLSNIYWQYVLFTTWCHDSTQKKDDLFHWDTNVNNIQFGDRRAQNYSAGMQNYKQTSSL